MSEQRDSLSKQGGIYLQATACDNARECEGIFHELAQALERKNYDRYRELVRNHLNEILQFYASFHDSQDFDDVSSISSPSSMFRICAEELKKPRANLPIAIRHIIATVPGGIKHLYFTKPGELFKASPAVKSPVVESPVRGSKFPEPPPRLRISCSPTSRPRIS